MGVTTEIQLSSSHRLIIVELFERLLPGVEVWVYGSRCKGTARPYSDLDLAAFASQSARRQVADLKEALEESDLPFQVDLFIWDDVPPTFQENIRAEHAVLIGPAEPLDES